MHQHRPEATPHARGSTLGIRLDKHDAAQAAPDTRGSTQNPVRGRKSSRGRPGRTGVYPGPLRRTTLATQIRDPASADNNWSEESAGPEITAVPALPLGGIGILSLFLALLGSRRGRNGHKN